MRTAAARASMAAFVLLGASSVARAQSTELSPVRDMETAPRVYGVGAIGVGGDVRAHGAATRSEAGVLPSGGAALGFEVPLGHAFSLGGEADFWVWSAAPDGVMDVSRSTLLELSMVPRFRCPWSDASGEQHFALGLALPVGPSLSLLREGDPNALSGLGTRDDRGWGVHLGALAEAQVFVTPRVGFLLDVGYVHHIVWHDAIVLGDRALQIDFGQLVVRFGIAVTL